MSVDPLPPEKPEDYAHAHDAQADRTRIELWVILAVVAVVVVGAIVWRAVSGHPAGPQAGWNRTDPPANPASAAAAGAGVPARGVGTPPPRPIAP